MSLDVMRARVAFRDRAFMDVMDLALRFVIVHIWLYAKVASMVLLPCALLTLAAGTVWGSVGTWLIAVFLSFIAQVPFTVLASRLVFQEHVSARAVVGSAARDVPRILVMRTVWSLLIALSGVAMLIGSAYVGAVLLYVDEVMILERARIVQALGRSQRIASGSLGEAFLGVLMVLAVPAAAVLLTDVGGRAFIGDLLQFRAPPPLWDDASSILAVLGWFAIIPYVTTARFFAYLNTRTRAEGWDIQTRFAALAARAEQEEAT